MTKPEESKTELGPLYRSEALTQSQSFLVLAEDVISFRLIQCLSTPGKR